MVATATVLAHVLSLLDFVKVTVQAVSANQWLGHALGFFAQQQLLFGIGCGFAAGAH